MSESQVLEAGAEVKPRHRHCCRGCTFLGRYGEFDLYHCNQAIGGPTVLARFGDDGPDYNSGIVFALEVINNAGGGIPWPGQAALAVAYMLARVRNLPLKR